MSCWNVNVHYYALIYFFLYFFQTTKMQALNHLHQAEKLMKILDFTDSVEVQKYISKAFDKVENWKPYPESRSQ